MIVLYISKCYEYFLSSFCHNEIIHLAKYAKVSNVKICNLVTLSNLDRHLTEASRCLYPTGPYA